MDHPALPDEIVVLPRTDVEGAWERFHPFEALHHLLEICNPMSVDDLQQVIDALEPRPGDRVLDVGCGHGDLLLTMAGRTDIAGVGVDLSPWVLLRASARAGEHTRRGSLEWWLGEGMAVPREARWDVATCLGASWIWHGFEGTARALSARLRPAGRLAIGDLRLREASLREILRARGAPEAAAPTEHEQLGVLRRLGLKPIDQIVAADEAWGHYHRQVVASAEAFAAAHPEADYRHMAAAWMEDFLRDRQYLAWTVWVARLG